MTPNPSFDGQRLKAWCPEDKTWRTWQAKYKNGELYWWCQHGVPKKALLASKNVVK